MEALVLWRMLQYAAVRVAQLLGQVLPMYVMKTRVSSNILARPVGTGQVKTSNAVSFRSIKTYLRDDLNCVVSL